MVTLTIDNRPVTVPEGTTILNAAKTVDKHNPPHSYLRQLNQVADVAQPDEVDALDGLSLADVEAGEYAFGKQLFSASWGIRPS